MSFKTKYPEVDTIPEDTNVDQQSYNNVATRFLNALGITDIYMFDDDEFDEDEFDEDR